MLCACLQFSDYKGTHEGLKIKSQPPSEIRRDWVGPADPESNLRQFKLYQPSNETELERQYRNAREETMAWNQRFWARHNKTFKDVSAE